ncbi:MAG: DNA polymerase III subunit delta [Alphaproteobacteria bacterium]|nr:DNA polymerase III subunit delta [Alphaproteobacteria bacterium]
MNIKPAQLSSFCTNPNPSVKCIVLFGTNEGLISEWQNKCAVAVCDDTGDAFRFTQFDAEDISKDGNELYGEYHAQSLMGGRRVVVVKNADAKIADILKKMLPETKSDNLLIITSDSYNTKTSLITWAKDRADIYTVGCYEDRDGDIASSAEKMLRERGISITPPVLQMLAAKLSPDRKMNQGEIDKLETYLGERKYVEADDVAKAVSDIAGANYDDLCYFTAEGNTDKACALYNRLLKEGENTATLVRQISYHFAKLLNVAAELENGKSAEEAIKILRPALVFYRKDSFLRQLKIWRKERILGALSMLYDCERDCKTTGIPAEIVAEYCILRLTGAANKFKRM